MDLGITHLEKLKALYTCFVFFYFVPRLVVFPLIYGERYRWTAFTLCITFAANYFVLREIFGGEVSDTLYEACFGPAMSIWMALLNSKIEKDNPGYYKKEARRPW